MSYDRRLEQYSACTSLHDKIAKVRQLTPPNITDGDIERYRNGDPNMKSLMRHIALFGLNYIRSSLSKLEPHEIDEILYYSICYDDVRIFTDLIPHFGRKCFKSLHPVEVEMVAKHFSAQQLYDCCVVYVTNTFHPTLVDTMRKYLLRNEFKSRLRQEVGIKREWFEWLC